jgi:hypothetical protein
MRRKKSSKGTNSRKMALPRPQNDDGKEGEGRMIEGRMMVGRLTGVWRGDGKDGRMIGGRINDGKEESNRSPHGVVSG